MFPFINVSNRFEIPLIMSYNTDVLGFSIKNTKLPKVFVLKFMKFLLYSTGYYKLKTILGTSLESIRYNISNGIISSKQKGILMLPIMGNRLARAP